MLLRNIICMSLALCSFLRQNEGSLISLCLFAESAHDGSIGSILPLAMSLSSSRRVQRDMRRRNIHEIMKRRRITNLHGERRE